LVDWDTSKGKPPVPLLKDAFATERRRAKTLNFSIAYGKTVHGIFVISLHFLDEVLNRGTDFMFQDLRRTGTSLKPKLKRPSRNGISFHLTEYSHH